MKWHGRRRRWHILHTTPFAILKRHAIQSQNRHHQVDSMTQNQIYIQYDTIITRILFALDLHLCSSSYFLIKLTIYVFVVSHEMDKYGYEGQWKEKEIGEVGDGER